MPVAPDGTSWEVRRRWVRRPRWREFNLFPDMPILDFDSLAGALALLALIAVFAVLALIFLPFVVFLVELILVLLAIPARFLLGRPWTIEAISSRGDELTWEVRGWRRSRRFMRRLAAAIERGERITGEWAPTAEQPLRSD